MRSERLRRRARNTPVKKGTWADTLELVREAGSAYTERLSDDRFEPDEQKEIRHVFKVRNGR